MNLRTFVSACAMVASLALPSLAGAQVRFHAGVSVGGPRPVYAPQPAPVVVAQPAPQVVYAQPAPPVVYAQPAPPVVYVRRAAPVHMRRRHPVVVVAPHGVVFERRHGRRHHGRR